ncbi:MAG: GNAT family N-acetyltransferase [Pseudomonadota bacterium]
MSAGAAKAAIRVARRGDESRLALVGRATFLESYAELLPAEDILAHTEQHHAPAVYAGWLADPRFRCWLVEAGAGKAPVGYVVLSPPDLPLADLSGSDMEIKRIYLLHPYQREGLGRALMEQATAYARDAGFARLLLGVYSRNTAALAFYNRIGFHRVGERQFRVGAGEYFDHILGINLNHGQEQ